MHLLVVDDTSPDGTYKIVKSHQKKYQNLHLLTNPKKAGIGYAYIVGFKHAMTKLKADFIFEFDGDFQHPPKMIPQMLEQATQGFDVVIGSRKIKGGSNPKGWGFKRIFFSEAGGLVARLILFFPGKNFLKVTDPTTGLRLTRVKGFLDQVDFDHFYSLEFSYKLQLLYQLISLNPKFKELPLQFGLREKGESKIKGSTLVDSLRTAFLTRINDPATKKFLNDRLTVSVFANDLFRSNVNAVTSLYNNSNLYLGNNFDSQNFGISINYKLPTKNKLVKEDPNLLKQDKKEDSGLPNQ